LLAKALCRCINQRLTVRRDWYFLQVLCFLDQDINQVVPISAWTTKRILNMKDKSFAVTMLPAPSLKEAINGVLYVHNLIDEAHGEVPVLPNAVPGDTIKLTVSNSDGFLEWETKIVLTAITIGKPIVLPIPKTTFERMLNAETNAVLQYSLESAGNQKLSMQLLIELKD